MKIAERWLFSPCPSGPTRSQRNSRRSARRSDENASKFVLSDTVSRHRRDQHAGPRPGFVRARLPARQRGAFLATAHPYSFKNPGLTK